MTTPIPPPTEEELAAAARLRDRLQSSTGPPDPELESVLGQFAHARGDQAPDVWARVAAGTASARTNRGWAWAAAAAVLAAAVMLVLIREPAPPAGPTPAQHQAALEALGAKGPVGTRLDALDALADASRARLVWEANR